VIFKSGGIVNLFEWRKAIVSEYGPKPTTRLVLLVLSLHMDKEGDRCFPSTKALERETGLSERSVCTHLIMAEKTGWIKKEVCGLSGQGWKRHKYIASIPEKVLKEVQYLNLKGTEPHAEGTEPHDIKALKEVQSSSSVNSSIITLSSNSIPYNAILKLWKEILPELPQPRFMTDTRKKHFKARWNDKLETQSGLKSNDSAFWSSLFKYCRDSDFLMGRKNSFTLSFDWLINKSNLVKVIEGNYHR
jgi:hypothetical protein